MNIEYKSITWDDFVSVKTTTARAFHEYREDIDLRAHENIFDPDRSIIAYEGDYMVGGSVSYPLDMYIPGGLCSIAAVAGVAVQPTHRRRGINTEIMKLQLENIHSRGEPLAVLQASESVIYGRYGYGMASFEHNLEIEKNHSTYAEDHIPLGSLYYCKEDEARQICPDIFDRATLNRVGMVTRNDKWWNFRSLEPGTKGGDGRTWYVRYENDGVNEGYVRYQVKGEVLIIIELISVTQDAYKTLWRFCLDMDLIKTIKANHRPVDEELKWLIADPRRLIEHTSDRSWLRLVNVEQALSLRKYSVNDSVVLDIKDRFLPWNSSRLELSSYQNETQCKPSTKAPDISLGVSELGAAYLGAVDFSTLARAGRVEELKPGGIQRINAMFVTDRKPWCFDGW